MLALSEEASAGSEDGVSMRAVRGDSRELKLRRLLNRSR